MQVIVVIGCPMLAGNGCGETYLKHSKPKPCIDTLSRLVVKGDPSRHCIATTLEHLAN